MRRISKKEWLKVLAGQPEEVRNAYQKQNESWPPDSFDQMLNTALERSALVARLYSCHCVEDAQSHAREIVENLREHFNNAITRDIVAHLNCVVDKVIPATARKYARQRKCHGGLRSYTCYCDERSH